MEILRHKGLSSAIFGGLAVAMLVVFVVQFRPGGQGAAGALHQDCAAEVKGVCVEPKEYFAALSLVAPARMIEPSQVKSMGLRRIVLDGLVERVLLEQDAARLGLSASEQDVDDELVLGRAHVSLPADKLRSLSWSLRIGDDGVRLLPVTSPDTKQFDYKTYDRVVRQFTNRSPAEFKNMQRREVVAARLRDAVRARARVSDAEAFSAYQAERSTSTVRFARFSRSWFAEHLLDLSPAAIDAWAAQHAEEVGKAFEPHKSQFLPECRAARHILIKVDETATQEEKDAARAKIDAALARVKGGEDFAAVARDVSQDGSAPQGGDLGCSPKGRMVKPFEDAMFSMKPGEISGVVETQFGYHVIKLESALAGADAEAYGKREEARSLMIAQEGEALAVEAAKRALAAAKAGAKLDDAVARAVSEMEAAAPKRKKGSRASDDGRPKVEVSAPFAAGGDAVPGVAPGQSADALLAKLSKDGDLPDDLLKLEDGWAIVQLKERSPATREQFDKDRDTYVQGMLSAKQADALDAYVARLRDAAKADIKVNEAYARSPEKSGDEE